MLSKKLYFGTFVAKLYAPHPYFQKFVLLFNQTKQAEAKVMHLYKPNYSFSCSRCKPLIESNIKQKEGI